MHQVQRFGKTLCRFLRSLRRMKSISMPGSRTRKARRSSATASVQSDIAVLDRHIRRTDHGLGRATRAGLQRDSEPAADEGVEPVRKPDDTASSRIFGGCARRIRDRTSRTRSVETHRNDVVYRSSLAASILGIMVRSYHPRDTRPRVGSHQGALRTDIAELSCSTALIQRERDRVG